MADTEVAPATIPSHSHPNRLSPGATHLSPDAVNGEADSAPISNARPPSPDTSSGVENSAKSPPTATNDEGQAAAAPYSTRSRNRGNAPRPNYSEDIEMDFERPLSRREVDLSTQSASVGAVSMAETESARGPSTIKLHTRHTNNADAALANAHSVLDERSSSPMPSDGRGETKKRKLTRTSLGKSGATPEERSSAVTALQAQIPGTSQFSAALAGSADGHYSKRRRTGDDLNRLPYQGSLSEAATCIVSFENSSATLQNGCLVADDGTTYARDDTVYLICEPPGDPYYICRIMEFRHKRPDDKSSPVISMLINWFYRPKDIGKFSSDVRHLFASMQSDACPLSSLRGKCTIKHRSNIDNLDEYRKQRDAFHFNQLYDRYSHRPYEIIPCTAVINIPPDIKKALDDRWKYIVVEQQAVKELTSPPKNCKLCHKYCAPNDSVDCGVCRDTFHLGCVDPPLPKRPSRGFAWSCGPCSRDREQKLEQRRSAVAKPAAKPGIEYEGEEASVEPSVITVPSGANKAIVDAPEPLPEKSHVAQSNLWPWRYLGVHCKLEDVLQTDDRAIYPRATSRIGTKHQAEVDEWPGQPFSFVKVMHSNKKGKGSAAKKDQRMNKETAAALQQEKAERAKRPAWVKDEPVGYVARGQDFDEADERCTAVPLFVKPAEATTAKPGFVAANARGSVPDDRMIEQYIREAENLAKAWGLVTTSKKGDPEISSNYLDQALRMLTKNKFNYSAALDSLKAKHDPKTLGNPDFSREEIQKFENGVSKHGSDLRSVRKHYLKGRSYGEVVRFYYTWKFTQRGSEVWGTHSGRKGVKRRAESSWADIADEEDDSAFDNDKAATKKRRFTCKFCGILHSRQWRRAPGVAPGATVLADPKGGKDKSNQLILALCQRCAHPWRRYAITWEDPDEIAKALLASGGRQWKRKNDEEYLRELVLANEAACVPTSAVAANAAAQIGIEVTTTQEPKKKLKNGEKEQTPTLSAAEPPKKKAAPPVVAPRPPTPPPEPLEPKWRQLPCAVCRSDASAVGEALISCKECRLTVHPRCYGLNSSNLTKWVCDTCVNDKQNQHSLRYECVLCPIKERAVQLLELPKEKTRKKSDRDRERERLGKLLCDQELENYQKSQRRKGRPIYPREALKPTADNNWMHITCATWTPEIKFGLSQSLQHAEGMGTVAANAQRMDSVCKICRIPSGSCVACVHCHAPFHVACAHDAGYTMGFDIAPVKGSRKDPNQIVNIGPETGVMTAAIWCKEHTVKTIVHGIIEQVPLEEGVTTALQLFTEVYKQADLTLTGTARKANLVSTAARSLAQAAPAQPNRRASQLVNGTQGKVPYPDGSITDGLVGEDGEVDAANHMCKTCSTTTTPKWHSVESQNVYMVNGVSLKEGPEYQCHRCFKRAEQGLPTAAASLATEKEAAATPLGEPPDLFRTKRLTPKQGPPGPEDLERFAEDIKSVTVTVTNPKFGGLHVFRGKDFDLDLERDPTPLFRYITYWAAQNCGYDQEHDVMITEQGYWITWPKSMMQALLQMVLNGTTEAHWRVVGARDIPCKVMDTSYLSNCLKIRDAPHPSHLPQQMRAGYPVGYSHPPYPPPPPPGLPGVPPPMIRSAYPPHPVHGTHGQPPPIPTGPPPPVATGHSSYPPQPLTRPPSGYATGPPPPGQPPHYPPPDALAQRPPTYYHRASNSGSGRGVGSPADVAMTGGASSSPSLKNLMH